MTNYPAFDKIPRLHRDVWITEKIDGTNALVAVLDADGVADPTQNFAEPVRVADDLWVAAGSRTRWIGPSADNYGFAAWVHDHAHELVDLGYGLHFGEWYGKGIQRGYGLDERRFALFNVDRWADTRPSCCGVVPLLRVVTGDKFNDAVSDSLDMLRRNGSRIVPGFDKPEGVVAYHAAARQYFKVLLENDDVPKSVRELSPETVAAFAERHIEGSFKLSRDDEAVPLAA